jgi:hypothetical protein
MTRERPSSHTLAVRFSSRRLPGRHSPTGSLSPLLPKAALPDPERRGTPLGKPACLRPCPPSRQTRRLQSP